MVSKSMHLAGLALVSLCLWASPAEAKRMKPVDYKICNKSKVTQSFATYSYVGRGRRVSHGWNAIAPNKCVETSADTVYFLGAPKTKGLSSEHPSTGCVLENKDFRFASTRETAKRTCQDAGGKMVQFRRPEGTGRKKSDIELR